MHDEQLAEKIRISLKGKHGITEKKMFGGLCFLHNGNMLCGVDNKCQLMVRVGAHNYANALKSKHAREMDFTGKSLKGMIYVDTEGTRTQTSVAKWIKMGLDFTATLAKK